MGVFVGLAAKGIIQAAGSRTRSFPFFADNWANYNGGILTDLEIRHGYDHV